MTLTELYVKRIRTGLMKLDDVPPQWKKGVEDLIHKLDEQNELFKPISEE